MSETNKAVGHVVSLTHWDREWRYPLWESRAWLVDMMDYLLDLIDREPRYRAYLLDGQTAPAEDYLEMRPEQVERLAARVAEGRIQIGPWFTLPDQYPVDGECLVRNLLWGRRSAERLGGCMNIGFTTFGWGQTTQLPQIYAGFGIRTIITAKRVSAGRAPESEFLWEAPDGTRALTTRLGDYARANFFFLATLPALTGFDYQRDWRFHWEHGGLPYHRADAAGYSHEYTRLDQPQGFHPDMLPAALEAAWRSTEETTVKDHRFLGDGSDFVRPEPRVLDIIDESNRLYPDREWRHSSLPEWVAALEAGADRDRLRVVCGELRDGPPEACSANALATRPDLKRLNRRAQDALLRAAEPLAAAAASLGAEYPAAFLRRAWRYLLQAQCHDSINGVTQDKTADDTRYRLAQVSEIAAVVADRACQAILRRVDLSRFDPSDVLLVLFNPLPFSRREVLLLRVDTPAEWDATEIAVEDLNGALRAVQRVSRRPVTAAVHEPNMRGWPFYADRHTVYLDTGDIPAGGYTTLRVRPAASQPRYAVFWPAAREESAASLSPAPGVLENDHLRVEVAPDGSLDALDKAAGTWHRGLHVFEDGGDLGDYWVRRVPGSDRLLTSRGQPHRVWLEHAGPLAATLGIETVLRVPVAGERDRDCRSEAGVDLTIRTHATLRRGAAMLEFETVVENTARDHRLRVLFPTDIPAANACAEGHFHIDRRPIDPARDPVNARWPEMRTLPQQAFVDVADDSRGLAVLNDGLCEYEVLPDRRTVALTLLRAAPNDICTEFRVASAYPEQEGGQSLGRLVYRYALLWHEGGWQAGGVQAAAHAWNVPPLVAQTGGGHVGQLPAEGSLFGLEPAGLVLSAFKRAEDRPTLVARVYNPTAAPLTGRLRLAATVARAWLTTLNEDREVEIPLSERRAVTFDALPERIVTLEVELADVDMA